ncbi:MAG: hypothetical protein PCFJNLEI_03223 [Verrucomicrobiae bacterium]|nr:hypothetical protein [Verrucomicrobiae bacterium]
MKTNPLPRIEWDFAAVPDSEITACCYWEYARESASLRGLRTEILAEWRERGARRGLTIGQYERTAKMFRRSDSRTSSILHLILDTPPRKSKSGNENSNDNIGSSFPEHWQNLSKAEQAGWAAAFSGKWDDGAISRRDEIYPSDLCREYAVFPGPMKRGTHRKKGTIPNSFLYPEGREGMLLEIAWGEYTNKQLVGAFRNWLKENRPKDIRGPDGRGRGLRVARADLVRLGVMRLLARYTALQILDPRRNACPEIWQSKQFSGAKWQDATKWYDARREARRVFQRLFPALPKAESPLSWSRARPAEKQAILPPVK